MPTPVSYTHLVEPEVAKSIKEKADLLDFSRLLHRETGHCSLYHITEQLHDLANVLDQQLIRGARDERNRASRPSQMCIRDSGSPHRFGLCHDA